MILISLNNIYEVLIEYIYFFFFLKMLYFSFIISYSFDNSHFSYLSLSVTYHSVGFIPLVDICTCDTC